MTKAVSMNSYDLSRAFFDWAYENPELVNPNHVALYFFIIEHCNRLGWKDKFGLPSGMAKEAIGIKSYRTYIVTFRDLESWGFITVIQQSKNQYSSNIISLVKNRNALLKNTNALDRAFIVHNEKCSIKKVQSTAKAHDKAPSKHMTKHRQSTGESNVTINKQVTSNNITSNNNSSLLNFEFFLLNFENVSHGKSDVPGIENFTEEEYIRFQAFLNLFKDYESRIERNPFPGIKFYRDKLDKFGFEDLQAGVEKMFALGVKSNMDLGLRLIDCIGWVREARNKPKKRSEITINDRLESQAKSIQYAKMLMDQDKAAKNL